MRPAIEVWRSACIAYGGLSIEGGEGEECAERIIEADRAELVAEIVAWLRSGEADWINCDNEIEAKWGKK